MFLRIKQQVFYAVLNSYPLSIIEGEVTVSVLEDGAPEEMGIIRDLSIFIMEIANEEDKKKIADLLGKFTGTALGKQDMEKAAAEMFSEDTVTYRTYFQNMQDAIEEIRG